MVKLVNRAKMTTSTTGTGTLSLGSAVDGFQTFGAAGLITGDQVSYVIEEEDSWEIGVGTYNSAGTLTRTLVQSSTGALLNLNGDAIVYVTLAADKLVQQDDLAAYVAKAGGTMTGFLTLSGDPTAANHAATKNYVDTVAAEGLHVHEGVDAATTGTLASISGGTVTYNNGTDGVGAYLQTSTSFPAIDGVTLTANADCNLASRVLVKNEANAAHNGIYFLSAANRLTRCPDFDSDADIEGGDFVFVVDGTQYASTGWVLTSTVNIIGADPLNWQQFSGAGTYSAGSGLTLSGTTFSHLDTSSQGSVSNTNTTVIQSVGLDTFGHVTSLASKAIDYAGVGAPSTTGTNATGTWSISISGNAATADAADSAATATTLTGLTSTVAELNVLDGITASTAELNFVDGVTSSIQTQLNNKQPLNTNLTTIGGLSTAANNFLVGGGTAWTAKSAADALAALGLTATAAELNVLDGIIASTAELNYVDGVTSAIQTQLDGKQATVTGAATTVTSSNLTAARVLISDDLGKIAASAAVTTTELGYLDGVTSAIQTQLNGKAASSHTHTASQITDFTEAVQDLIGTDLVAGTGISVSYNDTTGDTTLINTAPDQVVSITGSGATSVGGTYPSFTVSSTNTTYTAGSGLGLSGTEFSHADTSTQASVDNSGTTFIQDVTLDGFGHVTGLASSTVNLASFGITATAAELNALDGITATVTELNYVDGVTSAIQTQLNGKQATLTGAATSIASSNLTASAALVSDASGKVATSAVTATELGYLDGVTSSIQTQLNAKAPLASPGLTGTPTAPTAVVGTNTTQLATTAFVQAEIANYAPTKTGGGASGTWGISISGNAATATSATSATSATTATKLATARTISLTGGVTGSASFDGSANISISTTVGATAATWG